MAEDKIRAKIDEVQEQSEAKSVLKDLVYSDSAAEDYMSRIRAIQTIQDSYRSSQYRSTLDAELKHKPRFLVHIGGVGLNLMEENIVDVARNIQIIDVKSKKTSKHTLSIKMEHSTIFMGLVVFGNKIYVCGGRNVFGSFLMGEECPDVRKALYVIDIDRETITKLPQMRYPRSHHGFVVHSGNLWAVGGTDGNAPLKTTEKFDPI